MTNPLKPESFTSAKTLYGAMVEETQQLILVVEAANEEEACHRIDAVLPFLGVKDASGVSFVEVNSCPIGVASFLDAFFKGTGLGAVRDSVGPSTDTRH
jgi:hypothetical protein